MGPHWAENVDEKIKTARDVQITEPFFSPHKKKNLIFLQIFWVSSNSSWRPSKFIEFLTFSRLSDGGAVKKITIFFRDELAVLTTCSLFYTLAKDIEVIVAFRDSTECLQI